MRVARGSLNDRAALVELPLLFRLLDHADGNPVLHAAARIEILQLGKKMGLQSLTLFDVMQLQKRRVPDQIQNAVINCHDHPPIISIGEI